MIKDVQDWEVLGVLLGIQDPDTKFDKIKQVHKDPEKQKEAMIHHWQSTHPLASWSLLHQALNMKGDIQAAKAVKERFLKGVKMLQIACFQLTPTPYLKLRRDKVFQNGSILMRRWLTYES